MALPGSVRQFFGFALSIAQSGEQHEAAKSLKGFHGAGVIQLGKPPAMPGDSVRFDRSSGH